MLQHQGHIASKPIKKLTTKYDANIIVFFILILSFKIKETNKEKPKDIETFT